MPATGRWTGCCKSRTRWEKEVFGRVASLLNLEVGLLFSGTTGRYFELDGEDGPVPRDKHGNLAASKEKAGAGRPRSAPTATPRTAAMTCRRS